MKTDYIEKLNEGISTAFINADNNSNLAYKPEFIINSYHEGQKVLSVIERELSSCESFDNSIFIFVSNSCLFI